MGASGHVFVHTDLTTPLVTVAMKNQSNLFDWKNYYFDYSRI